MYQTLVIPFISKTEEFIVRTADSAFIPSDPDNTDYQEYLEWLAEGNTPEAAD